MSRKIFQLTISWHLPYKVAVYFSLGSLYQKASFANSTPGFNDLCAIEKKEKDYITIATSKTEKRQQIFEVMKTAQVLGESYS